MNNNQHCKSKKIRLFVACLTCFFPQCLKRFLLNKILGFEIHSTASIGFSLVYPNHLVMGCHSRIGHLTLCKGLSLFSIGDFGIVGNLNWISGEPLESAAFSCELDRKPQLKVGNHAAITNRHYLDCNNSIKIGKFSTFAGVRSQILTHAIDLTDSTQKTAPVLIGDYCFVGTNAVLLAGTVLPSYCVLGASACLAKEFSEEYMLYAGVPAKAVKKLAIESEYFKRKKGVVL